MIKLNTLFHWSDSDVTGNINVLHQQELGEEVVRNIASSTKLVFSDGDAAQNNLCLANDREVRPEYRTSFNKMDVIDYIIAFLPDPADSKETKEQGDSHFLEVPLPENAALFWEAVQRGRRLKKRRI